MLEEHSDAEDAPIFLGGINVYLQQQYELFHHTPRWLDRLADSRWLLTWAAHWAGMTRASDLGEMTLSMLRGEAGRQEKEIHRLVDWLKSEPRPDVVLLSNCLLLGLAPALRRELQVPLLCTLQGEDGFLDALPSPYQEEAWKALSRLANEVNGLVAVSRYYAESMTRRLRLDADRVFVVENGILLDDYPLPERKSAEPALGYLARLCECKGLHRLVDAFIVLKQNPRYARLRLHVAGAMTSADQPYVDQLKQRLAGASLQDYVEWHPNLSRAQKIEFLRALSVLSVPAHYGESFGLYVIEALAAGTPVVQPNHGGFPEILQRTGGGLLYDPDRTEDYHAALQRLLDDPAAAQAMARQGRDVVLQHYTAERMAADFIAVCSRVCSK
ncbi:MAG: hypothetical protein A3G75_14410 [Verrucomicrobia bacterium RIFCSPLOWO2_12_FULL_64_8]|nr:MAG: hypothetical protein A3G75_14410 [Verrucomicrobia bacterium RIFCSPLOWO2_12_FULL_64_8]